MSSWILTQIINYFQILSVFLFKITLVYKINKYVFDNFNANICQMAVYLLLLINTIEYGHCHLLIMWSLSNLTLINDGITNYQIDAQ